MARLDWDDTFSVGAAMIDQDHRRLLGELNRLAETVDRGDTKGARDGFDSLFEAILRHFEREERFLLAHRYPDVETHHRTHAFKAEQILTARDLCAARLAHGEGQEVVDYLVEWLERHIRVEDMEYARFLARLPPASARPALAN
ncbi:MAG: bacteriohemerythrin [Rhodospirillales bacterium]|nr:bacteriohemerythrin [Rhodospirillales bacterium]